MRTICTSVSLRVNTKMCPCRVLFTIFWVLVRCVGMCSVWVCGVSWSVVGVFGCVCWCAWLCVVVCRCGVSCTLSTCRKTYTYRCTCLRHSFCSSSHEKKSRTLTFRDVYFSKPLTFHKTFMCFCFSLQFEALLETSSYNSFTNHVGLEFSKSAWNCYEKQKTWNHCGRSRASKQTSWKVFVLYHFFSWQNEQKRWRRHVHLFVYKKMYM